MSQPTYSNNKEDVEKFKKILGVCSGTAKAKRWNGCFFDMPRESKRRKKPDSIRISGSC
jgi:hypothetical protein